MHAGAPSDDERSHQTKWYHLRRESQLKSMISDVQTVMVPLMRKMVVLVYIFVFGGGIELASHHPGGVEWSPPEALSSKKPVSRLRRPVLPTDDRTAVSESALSFDRPEVRSVGRRRSDGSHFGISGWRAAAAAAPSSYDRFTPTGSLKLRSPPKPCTIFFPPAAGWARSRGEGGRRGGREQRERASHLADRWNARARPSAPMPPAPDAVAAALSLLSLSIASIASSKGPSERRREAASLGTLPCVSPPPFASLPFR